MLFYFPCSSTQPYGRVWFFLLLMVCVCPAPLSAASRVRGPYLQLVTSRSAVIRWRTDVPVDSLLRFGTNAAALDQSRLLTSSTTEHEVPLDGLMPSMRYYYEIAHSGGVLAGGADYFLQTAPDPGTPMATRVWVVGDSGSANANARRVRDAYLEYAGTRHTDLFLMLGDNAYENGTDAEMQSAIFNTYAALLRSTPLWPSIGNHDTAGSSSPPSSLPYFQSFTLPMQAEAGGLASGTEKYYSYNHANIHFIVLDSMSSGRGANASMATWLRNDLALNSQDWVIAYWHHAPYSKGGADSDSTSQSSQMRQNLVPILEAGGVDLVLAGHSHNYERSYLMTGHYGTSSSFQPSMNLVEGDGNEAGDGAYLKYGVVSSGQGTVYVVAGSSSRLIEGPLDHPAMPIGFNTLGSVVLDIEGPRLEARFLDDNAVVRDVFTILKTNPEEVVFTRQPQALSVVPGTDVLFRAEAVSIHPITYQWNRNGIPLTGATNPVLSLINVQEMDDGFYQASATDVMATVWSKPARLAILVSPEVILPPLDLTVVEGGSITLSIESRGTLPMGYRWRLGFNTVANVKLFSNQSFLLITNASLNDAGRYTVVLTNEVYYLPGILSPGGILTVLADGDGDRMPDVWEIEMGLDPDNPGDALWDGDGDGLSHLEEYEAGTHPMDPESYLRIERIHTEEDVEVVFQAVSNRTYTVEYMDQFDVSGWNRLQDIAATPTNRTVTVRDFEGGPRRFYRLRTPRRP